MGLIEPFPLGGADYRLGFPFNLPQKTSFALPLIRPVGKLRADVDRDNGIGSLILS